jgi:hypothetical protein
MGPQGLQGEKGLQGDIGTKGEKGDSGRDGFPGLGLYAVSQGEMYPVYGDAQPRLVKIDGTWWQNSEHYSVTPDVDLEDPSTWVLSATVGWTGYWDEPIPSDALVFKNQNCSGNPMGWLSNSRRTENGMENDSSIPFDYFDDSAIKLFSKYYKATYSNSPLSEIGSHQDSDGNCQLGLPSPYEGTYFSNIKFKLHNLVEIRKPNITFDPVLRAG